MEIIYRGLLRIALDMMIENEHIAYDLKDWWWREQMEEQVNILMQLLDKVKKYDKMKKEGGEEDGIPKQGGST